MITLEEIIKEKADRLSSAPAELETGIEEFQRFIYEHLLGLLSELDSKEGYFLKSEKNRALAADIISEIKLLLSGREYRQTVTLFARQFDQQKSTTDEYFKKMFGADFDPTAVNDQIFEASKSTAIKLLQSATPKTDFLYGLSTEIDKAISTSSSWSDTVASLRTIAIGSSDIGKNDRYIKPKDGKLLRYTKQIASDALAISDRSYTYAIAQDLDAEWFYYFGDELPTSREFCKERHGKYFHKNEVQAWASLQWAGKMADSTNEQTIFVNCGGWRCQHSLLPVTIDHVNREERDAIIRNISNGNYIPTQFDIDELDLPAAA